VNKFALLVALLSAGPFSLDASRASAAVIPTLFSTGVDAGGSVVANDTLGDAHYSLTSVPGGSSMSLIAVTSAHGFPVGGVAWNADNTISRWIAPANNTASGPRSLSAPAGDYTYRTTFDLTGFIPGTASISGQWASDNNGLDILINGVSTGNTHGDSRGVAYQFFKPFTISSGFVAGMNTLDFVVNNFYDPIDPDSPGPNGLRVELFGTAERINTNSTIPEPTTLAIWGLGALGLAFYRRRTKRTTACAISA